MNEKTINMDTDHKSHQEFALMRSQGIIGFRISGELLMQIEKWEYMIDEKIFKEQLATGLYDGKYPLDNIQLDVMRQAEKEGKILPYFHAHSARGCLQYHFNATREGFHIVVKHSVAKKSFGIDLTQEEIGVFLDKKTAFNFKYAPFQYMGEKEEKWKNKPNKIMTFIIEDVEYKSLSQWGNWNEEEALTPRFEYIFEMTSMVPCIISVRDKEKGSEIDITDYGSW